MYIIWSFPIWNRTYDKSACVQLIILERYIVFLISLYNLEHNILILYGRRPEADLEVLQIEGGVRFQCVSKKKKEKRKTSIIILFFMSFFCSYTIGIRNANM